MITLTEEQAQQIDESLLRVEQSAEESEGDDGMAMVVPLDLYNELAESLETIRAARAQADHIADADNMVREPVDTLRGFSLWLDREAWGHVIDGLMLERERSEQRKAANPESNSNHIANRCAELIAQIGQVSAAPVEPVKQEPVACVRSLTEQCAALVWERDELQKKLRQYEKHGVTCQTYQHKVERSCSECNENENYANSVQQAEQEPEYKGWYCAHCERGVDGSEVTFHEQHEVCGRVITDDVPPKPVQQAEQEPVGKIVAFGGSLHEVSWRRGKMPPLGTDLYAAPVEHRRKNRE